MTGSNIERPGVDKSWLDLNAYRKRLEFWEQYSRESDPMRFLQEYAKLRWIPQCLYKSSMLKGHENPAWKSSAFVGAIGIYPGILAYRCEQSALKTGVMDWSLVRNVYTYGYVSMAIESHVCPNKSALLWGGGVGGSITGAQTLLGLALGCQPQSIRLAKAYVAAISKRKHPFPEGNYLHLIEILADYFGMSVATQSNGPILDALLHNWRTDNLSELSEILLAVCDLHTRQFNWDLMVGPNFYNDFIRFPVEILALFRLRQWLGLENPVLDHPLMQSPLGVLPPEQSFFGDKLFDRVYTRMVKQGFNDEEIFKTHMKELGFPEN